MKTNVFILIGLTLLLTVFSCETEVKSTVGVSGAKAEFASHEINSNEVVAETVTLNDGCTYAIASIRAYGAGGGADIEIIHSPACNNPKHSKL